MSSEDIVKALIALDDRPWATCSRQDKALTKHRLARLLRQFHILPAGTIRLGDKVRRSYRRAAFEESWARYPFPTVTRNKPNNDGPEPEEPTVTQTPSVTVEKMAVEPMNTGDCYGVTVENQREARFRDF